MSIVNYRKCDLCGSPVDRKDSLTYIQLSKVIILGTPETTATDGTYHGSTIDICSKCMSVYVSIEDITNALIQALKQYSLNKKI